MKKRAVTLLEIIIALFVFAVGILAVIRVITTNIAVIDTMKVKIQAESLAKEGIDIIFNIRDTNLERGMNRQCAYISDAAIASLQNWVPFAWQICGSSFSDGSKYRVGVDVEWRINIATTTTGNSFEETFGINQLQEIVWANEYTGTLLLHSTQGTGSYFARYISFAPVYQSGTALDTNKLLKVTSHVLYRKWSIKGEIVLDSFIGAIKK